MKRLLALIICSVLLTTCNSEIKNKNKVAIKVTEEYELHQSIGSKSVLVLFPALGTTSVQTKNEFDILSIADKNDVSVLLMNLNRYLWLTKSKTKELAQLIQTIFKENELSSENVYIGGLSIGGNISLTLSNYLCKNTISPCPKGIFIVDSPIDLGELYSNAVIDLNNEEHSIERLAEPKWIVNYFEANLGQKDTLEKKIAEVSPFNLKLSSNNVNQLKKRKLRFYAEPDREWWITNQGTKFENTNAYTIQRIYNQLINQGWNSLKLIETKNQGFRANGKRHPHSWSIVNTKELINWIKE